MPLSKLVLPRAPTLPPTVTRRAAVAIVVGPDTETLFIRRATREGDPWSGDMAFPGGREHPEDPSLQATAERETREEVGLDLSGAELVGALDVLLSPFRDPSGHFGVAPYVYRIDAFPPLTPNHEVASTHLLSLERLRRGEGRGEFTLTGYGPPREMPCVRIDGVFIWGMTLRMLDTLLARLDG